MKLTDQEQVILKAIAHVGHGGLAEVSKVIKAVGYPKATTKKILARLSEKGIVALHRHDYPASLTPEQRKLMVRIGRDYYNAVSVMKRNPKGKHLAGATAKQQRQYEAILKSIKKSGRYKGREKEVAARTVRARAKNKSGKGKQALKTTGRALKSAARGILGAGSQILGAGAKALNPVRRKVRNKYIDLVIRGQAKKTPQGWKVGKKTFAQGRGTVSVSSGYYLDRHTGMVYAKRERNMAKRRKRRNVEMGFYDASGFHPIRASSDYSEGTRPSRSRRAKSVKRKAKVTASHRRKVTSRKATTKRLASRAIKKTVKSRRRRNISEGFYDASGVFHPIRSASDYSPAAAGEAGRKAKHTRSRKRLSAKRKASSTARTKSRVRARKAATRIASRSLSRRTATGKKLKRATRNPSPEAIRKSFAGSVSGSRELYFPQGTPQGLAKLGKLVSITTEEGTIKPVSGTAWLCADTKGKLHIGSTTQAPLFDGPKRSFGRVSKFEYQDVKKHLGHNKQTIFFHHAGEENGIKPTLYADGKGGLIFKGGDYRITSRGVEN